MGHIRSRCRRDPEKGKSDRALRSDEGKIMDNDTLNAEKEQDIDEIISMIDGKMGEGVGRLLVSFSKTMEEGTHKEVYHHGRCDVLSPWANGTVGNCDQIDTVFTEEGPRKI